MDVVYRPLGVTEEREWGGTGQFGGWESYITPVGGGSIEGSQRDDGGRLHHTRGVRWHTAQARYIRGVHGHSRTPCRALAQPQTRCTGSPRKSSSLREMVQWEGIQLHVRVVCGGNGRN